jgi:hypothetical protein
MDPFISIGVEDEQAFQKEMKLKIRVALAQHQGYTRDMGEM